MADEDAMTEEIEMTDEDAITTDKDAITVEEPIAGTDDMTDYPMHRPSTGLRNIETEEVIAKFTIALSNPTHWQMRKS